MKKQIPLMFLILLVIGFHNLKTAGIHAGEKAGISGVTMCPKVCASLSNCVDSKAQNANEMKRVASLSCEILCTKQFQSFSSCTEQISKSCDLGTKCIKEGLGLSI
ncbi:Cys-rich protein [Leptospira ryugenii]|uniref:Cys-rich protein n=1 Tax=Leptospira ryugenii TaxID=1917863 RepID=UPI000D5A097E|nr:Cys-rich protein [Leptospira ryugenii]